MEEQEFIDSKFRLVILAAKRAKQLLKGSKRKIEMVAENPLTVALQEFREGKIDPELLFREEYEGFNQDEESAEGESGMELLAETDSQDEDLTAQLVEDSDETDDEETEESLEEEDSEVEPE